MPLLFQRRIGVEHRAIPPTRYAGGSAGRSTGPTSPTLPEAAAVHPHDFRRMFITDAVMHGMRHTSPSWSPDIATSTRPWDTRPSTRRGDQRTPSLHRSPAGAASQRRVPRATEQEWASSSATSNDARSASALVAAHTPLRASTNTPACAARCYGPILPAPSADRGSRQSDRSSRRSPTGGLAR